MMPSFRRARSDRLNRSKDKLRALARLSKRRQAAFALVLKALLLVQHLVDYYLYLNINLLFARRRFVKRTRPHMQAHWLGRAGRKPHRLAFLLLVVLILAGLVTAPTPASVIDAAIAWGAVFSFFVIYRSLAVILHTLQTQRTQKPFLSKAAKLM